MINGSTNLVLLAIDEADTVHSSVSSLSTQNVIWTSIQRQNNAWLCVYRVDFIDIQY